MSLLVRLATRYGDILDLGVGADQFTVVIISQGKNPGKSPCEKTCCWLSNCYMLRLSRIRPRVIMALEALSHVPEECFPCALWHGGLPGGVVGVVGGADKEFLEGAEVVVPLTHARSPCCVGSPAVRGRNTR